MVRRDTSAFIRRVMRHAIASATTRSSSAKLVGPTVLGGCRLPSWSETWWPARTYELTIALLTRRPAGHERVGDISIVQVASNPWQRDHRVSPCRMGPSRQAHRPGTRRCLVPTFGTHQSFQPPVQVPEAPTDLRSSAFRSTPAGLEPAISPCESSNHAAQDGSAGLAPGEMNA